MKRVKIEVTEQDIALGRPRSPWSCPIARAIDRALPLSRPTVGCDVELIVDGKEYADVPLPIKAQQFIENFDDNRKSVKPFTFTLRLP